MLIEKITNGEAKKLQIKYSYADTDYGQILLASTSKGIAYIGFSGLNKDVFTDLQKRFPQVELIPQTDAMQKQAIDFLNKNTKYLPHFHLKGTDFQITVWNALLKIPSGEVVSYQEIASWIGKPKSCRAVGSAIGKNPVSILIPCHRVIRSSGELGGFYWGLDVKKMILDNESKKQKTRNSPSLLRYNNNKKQTFS